MIYSVLKTMRSVFPQVYLIATADPASDELQNFIFVGHNADSRIDLQQAAAFKFDYPVLNRVAGLELRPAEDMVDSAFLLTDDFAPVEYYAVNVIRKYDAASRKVN
jgi:hypothetical protein